MKEGRKNEGKEHVNDLSSESGDEESYDSENEV